MSENIQRNRGRSKNYKFDRGGNPTEFGPFIGEVKNNVDNVRSGRLQVYIEQFGGDNPDDESLWRTVNYIPPFYGAVSQTGTNTGTGTFVGNPQSYGAHRSIWRQQFGIGHNGTRADLVENSTK